MEELEFKQEERNGLIWLTCQKNEKTVSSAIPKARYDDYLIAKDSTPRNHPRQHSNPIEMMKWAMRTELNFQNR